MIPSTTLTYLLDRLNQNYVQDTLFDSADVLTFLNDAYLEACERSLCLQAVTEILLEDGVETYPLPGDFSQLIYVVSGGIQLNPVSRSQHRPGDVRGFAQVFGYYLLNDEIGFVPTPLAQAGRTMLTYAAVPAPFTDYASEFDPRFPIEFSDMLAHYVLWRTSMMSGGAEAINLASVNRGIFDQRVTQLRRSIDLVQDMDPQMIAHAADYRMLHAR